MVVGQAALQLRHRGGADLRRAGTAQESDALAALMVACIAQAMRDVDEGVPFDDPPPRMIEENMWRAIRFGLDGRLIDLERGEEYPARAAIERLAAWTAPIRAELGIEPAFPERNGAQRQRERIAAGATREEVFAASVAETQADLFRGGGGVRHAPTDHYPTVAQTRRTTDEQRSRPRCRASTGTDQQRRRQPSEEQLRAAYEAELSRITSADMILQSGGVAAEPRRSPPRVWPLRARRASAISSRCATRSTACGRCLEILERSAAAQELRPLRDALSQLQMAYAREAQAGGGATGHAATARPAGRDAARRSRRGRPDASPAADKPGAPPTEGKPGAGPAESSGRLWVPGR